MCADYSPPKLIAEWSPALSVWEPAGAAGTPCFCGHLMPYSETLPTSGMTRNGRLYALPKLGGAHGRARVFITAHPVSIGSGGRPDLTITRCARGAHAAAHRPDSRPYPPREPARLMPTPGANLGTNGGAQHPNKRRAGGHQVSIQDVARGLVEDHASSFGPYAPAISRWEQTIGRPAPPPTQPGRSRPQLSASFVEWLMGLPDGHVTGAPGLTRSQQLKALGNGVMPQQGAEALRRLHEARGL